MSVRVLVCDDEPYILHALRMKLSKSGFDVETADNGETALAAVRRELPALLITDLQMPVMDGLALCRALRSDPATEGLPIILLTAKGFEIDSGRLAEELRLSEVVFKPFSPRELLRSAENAIAAGAPVRPASSAADAPQA
jgi:CheY-like chemotaxis protein